MRGAEGQVVKVKGQVRQMGRKYGGEVLEVENCCEVKRY